MTHNDVDNAGRRALATGRWGAFALAGLLGCVTSPDLPDPAVIEIVSGNDQVQGRGRSLHEPIVVRAVDAASSPIAGVALRFSTGPGSGVVEPRQTVTDSIGEAAVTWVLGGTVGTQTLVASVPGRRGVSVEILATARPGDFDIQVVVDSGYSEAHAATIRAAAERWTAVIVGDLPDYPVDERLVLPSRCLGIEPFRTPAGGVVDDVQFRMNFNDDPGDGYSYGICYRRTGGQLMPAIVYMKLNEPAIRSFEPQLEGFVTHILGHLLGFGWGWRDQLENPARILGVGADTHFPDPATVAAFDAAGGADWSGSKVPVENHGPEWIVDVHWRRSVMGTEIMSPEFTDAFRLKALNQLPLSAITVHAMAAIGYEVDVGKADPYMLPDPAVATVPGTPPLQPGPAIDIWTSGQALPHQPQTNRRHRLLVR